MRNRKAVIAGILPLVCCALFLMFFYGPLRRTYAVPAGVEPAFSAADISQQWEAAGVKGRVAVLFTRHLNSEESLKDTEGFKFAELAMSHGIVRTIFHVVPDNAWPVVTKNLSVRDNARTTSSGFALIVPEGRINVLPLSRFKPFGEKSLIVVEPGVWNREELAHITRLIESRDLCTDLLVVVRGAPADIETFSAVLPPLP